MDPNLKRFMDKLEKTPTCWVWKAQILPSGYGGFWLNKNITAHRASWILHNGEIPSGVLVCHTCDNHYCVNPDHLFLGTYKDNSEDMVKKGRAAKQIKKLTTTQEQQALNLYKNGMPQREIAKLFNINQATIWRYIHKTEPMKLRVGEDNNKSKLTKKQVLEMRAMYIPRKLGFHRIAKLFGVYKSTVERAIKGETWKHI